MSRIGTFILVAIAAPAPAVMQPKPAQAGSSGFIAGLAIGVATAAIVHHHRRAHAGYYHRPRYTPRVYHRLHHRHYCGRGRCGHRHPHW